MYAQCSLKSKNKGQVAYIPEEFAKVGKLVEIEGRVWEVLTVGTYISTPIYPRELIKEHRKNTGDSLPRHKEESSGR